VPPVYCVLCTDFVSRFRLHFNCIFASSSEDKKGEAARDCRSGEVHVLLVKYGKEATATLWSEPLHLIRRNYYIDPWNQGSCVLPNVLRCIQLFVCLGYCISGSHTMVDLRCD
jgi:hypothetical protein